MQADRGQQLVFIAGQLLALNHHQRQIQPAEAAWTPHKKLSVCLYHDHLTATALIQARLFPGQD
jgi:hypothetical protein